MSAVEHRIKIMLGEQAVMIAMLQSRGEELAARLAELEPPKDDTAEKVRAARHGLKGEELAAQKETK